MTKACDAEISLSAEEPGFRSKGPHSRTANTLFSETGRKDDPTASVSFAKSNASVLLDVLRGAAAWLVLIEHWRNFLFIDYTQLTAHRALFILPYLLTSAGHQAVIIFFVLSGYLVGGSVLRMLQRRSWSWPTYLTHRLMRLWVVLLPGLLLCLLWDKIGIHIGVAPGLYRGTVDNHMGLDVTANLGVRTFVENIFFLQGLLAHTFGSDGALWSLTNEFWYYILFPLGLMTLHARSRMSERVLSGLVFLLIAFFVIGPILWLFPIWLAGTLLCRVRAPRVGKSARAIATVLYVFLIFFCARQKVIHLSAIANDYLLAAGTFLFLWILLSSTGEAKPSSGHTIGRWLARFSYTLYVVHMPMLLLLTAFFAHDTRWVPDAPHVLKSLVVLGITIAYSYGIATVTEFHTDEWRRWFEVKFKIGPRNTSIVVTRA